MTYGELALPSATRNGGGSVSSSRGMGSVMSAVVADIRLRRGKSNPGRSPAGVAACPPRWGDDICDAGVRAERKRRHHEPISQRKWCRVERIVSSRRGLASWYWRQSPFRWNENGDPMRPAYLLSILALASL